MTYGYQYEKGCGIRAMPIRMVLKQALTNSVRKQPGIDAKFDDEDSKDES